MLDVAIFMREYLRTNHQSNFHNYIYNIGLRFKISYVLVLFNIKTYLFLIVISNALKVAATFIYILFVFKGTLSFIIKSMCDSANVVRIFL